MRPKLLYSRQLQEGKTAPIDLLCPRKEIHFNTEAVRPVAEPRPTMTLVRCSTELMGTGRLRPASEMWMKASPAVLR